MSERETSEREREKERSKTDGQEEIRGKMKEQRKMSTTTIQPMSTKKKHEQNGFELKTSSILRTLNLFKFIYCIFPVFIRVIVWKIEFSNYAHTI